MTRLLSQRKHTYPDGKGCLRSADATLPRPRCEMSRATRHEQREAGGRHLFTLWLGSPRRAARPPCQAPLPRAYPHYVPRHTRAH